MYGQTDVNYEHAILISGLPRRLAQIARDRIFEFVSSASVMDEEVDSSGMKIFFKDYNPVRKVISKRFLHIEGRNYFIHLLITPLTVHGIVAFVGASELKSLIQSWGRILKIYEEEKPVNRNSGIFDRTGNYRVILMRSEAEQFIPQETLRVPSIDREFDVTLYCRCCLGNGHCRLTCPALAECSKGSSIGNQQNFSSAHLKDEHSESGRSPCFPGVYQEELHKDTPCYWTQAGRGREWRNNDYEEMYHPIISKNNLESTETKCRASIKQVPETSSSETDRSFERDCFKEGRDKSTVENGNYVNVNTRKECRVPIKQELENSSSETEESYKRSHFNEEPNKSTKEYDKFLDSGYMDNTAQYETHNPPKCLSRMKSYPESTFEQNSYQVSRRCSAPCSSNDVREPELLSDWRLIHNDFPASERSLQWPTNLNAHNFQERRLKFSSGPNDCVLPEGRSEWQSEFNVNHSTESQSDMCSYVPNHLLPVRSYEIPSTSNESHVSEKHSRRLSQFNETYYEQSISGRSSDYFNTYSEEKVADLYDGRKLENELPSTDDEMSTLHQRGQSNVTLTKATKMTSSLFDDEYRLIPHSKLTDARLNNPSSENTTDDSTEENGDSSEFPVQNNNKNRNFDDETQSIINFKSIVPFHLRKKNKMLKELCRNLPHAFQKYTLKDKNAIHDLEEVIEFNLTKFRLLTVGQRNFITWLQKKLETYKETHAHQQDNQSLVNTDGYNKVSNETKTEIQIKVLSKGKNKQGALLSSRESSLTDNINTEENVSTPAQHSTDKPLKKFHCLKSGKKCKNEKVITERKQLVTSSLSRHGRESDSFEQEKDRGENERNLIHHKQEQTYETIPNETSMTAHTSLSGKKSIIENSRGIPSQKRQYLKTREAKRKQMQNRTPKKLNDQSSEYGECSTSRKEISSLSPKEDKSEEPHHPYNSKDNPLKEKLVQRNTFNYHHKSETVQKIRQLKKRKGGTPPYSNTRTMKISKKCTPGLYRALRHVGGILSYFDFQRFLSHTRRLQHPGKILRHIKEGDNIPKVVDGVISQLQNILNHYYSRLTVGRWDNAEARILQDLVKRMMSHRSRNCKVCLCLQDE